jgi:ferrochelatase
MPSKTAVLVLSFGGPEGPDDVMPFLRQVTRGRDVPDERLAVVASQYQQFGGRSPINDQNRALIEALRVELEASGHDLPIYWGNRNWHPFVNETVATMAADGITEGLVFATSAFGSYSGCRQYQEDLRRASETTGPDAPTLEKLRLFYNHPGFIEPMAANLAALMTAEHLGARARIVFTAHSIPQSMASSCDYTTQLEEAAALVMSAAGIGEGFDLVFQSRSGPPSIPWLEPDINDHLVELDHGGISEVVVVPLGFISDHMEVIFDLDTQAKATADRLGMTMHRVPTVGAHPRFVTMIRELIEERLTPGRQRLALGRFGPWPDVCPPDHCLPPSRPGTRA